MLQKEKVQKGEEIKLIEVGRRSNNRRDLGGNNLVQHKNQTKQDYDG